jgi:hypothetical protein
VVAPEGKPDWRYPKLADSHQGKSSILITFNIFDRSALADLWPSYQLFKFVRYLLFGFPVIGLGGNFPVDKKDFRPSPATLKWQHPYPIRQEGFAIWHASKGWQNFLLYAGSLVLCHFSANDGHHGWCWAASRSVNSSAYRATSRQRIISIAQDDCFVGRLVDN